MFNSYHKDILEVIDEWMGNINVVTRPNEEQNDANIDMEFADGAIEDVEIGGDITIQHRLYTCIRRTWHIPKEFNFPSAKLLPGWLL